MEIIALNLQFYECAMPSGSLSEEEEKHDLGGDLQVSISSYVSFGLADFYLETKSPSWNHQQGSQRQAAASEGTVEVRRAAVSSVF